MACHNEIPKKDISQIGTSRYIYVPTVDLFSHEFWYNIYSAISEIIFIGAPVVNFNAGTCILCQDSCGYPETMHDYFVMLKKCTRMHHKETAKCECRENNRIAHQMQNTSAICTAV